MTTRSGVMYDAATLRRDVARLRATGSLYDVEEHTVSAGAGVTCNGDRFSEPPPSPGSGGLPARGDGTWFIIGAQAGSIEEQLSTLRGTRVEVTAARAIPGALGADVAATSLMAALC